MGENAVARQLRDLARDMRASARSRNIDEESLVLLLVAGANLHLLAERIEPTRKKPAVGED